MLDEVRRLWRYGAISLAITVPTMFAGGFLLRSVGEEVAQAFALFCAFLGIAIVICLVEWDSRREQRRDQ